MEQSPSESEIMIRRSIETIEPEGTVKDQFYINIAYNIIKLQFNYY